MATRWQHKRTQIYNSHFVTFNSLLQSIQWDFDIYMPSENIMGLLWHCRWIILKRNLMIKCFKVFSCQKSELSVYFFILFFFIWLHLPVFAALPDLFRHTRLWSARRSPCLSWCWPARRHPGTPCAYAWEGPRCGSWTSARRRKEKRQRRTTQVINNKSRSCTFFFLLMLSFILIVSGCLHPAPSQGRAA